LPFRGRGLRPPGPVVAPLVPRCALLPAPSPWVRAEPRELSAQPTRVDREEVLFRSRTRQTNTTYFPEGRVGGGPRCGAAQHVPRGTGREGVRSEARAEQRLAPGGGAPCPGKPTVRSPLPRNSQPARA